MLTLVIFCELVMRYQLITFTWASLHPTGVILSRQLRSVQVFPPRGEYGHRRVLFCWGLPALPAPGPLSVDEGPAPVSEPLLTGEAQVAVNYDTQHTKARDAAMNFSIGDCKYLI